MNPARYKPKAYKAALSLLKEDELFILNMKIQYGKGIDSISEVLGIRRRLVQHRLRKALKHFSAYYKYLLEFPNGHKLPPAQLTAAFPSDFVNYCQARFLRKDREEIRRLRQRIRKKYGKPKVAEMIYQLSLMKKLKTYFDMLKFFEDTD